MLLSILLQCGVLLSSGKEEAEKRRGEVPEFLKSMDAPYGKPCHHYRLVLSVHS